MENSIQQKIGGYALNREYDIRGIMIPRIGDLLYYDTFDMQAVIQEYDDERFYNTRYMPVGVIVNISKDMKTLKIVTPYLLQICLDLKERISEKNMIKTLKSFVRKYTAEMFKTELEDMKFNLTTADDLQMIIDNSESIIQGINKLGTNINVIKELSISEIIKKGLLIYNDNNKIKLTYGLSDNFNKVSTNDIRMEDRDTNMNIVKTIKDFKELYTDLNNLECYIIPIATITLD